LPCCLLCVAIFVFNPCLLLAKEACLFEAFLLILIKATPNNKNEARAKVKKQNNWRERSLLLSCLLLVPRFDYYFY
jgi:hypothetical protein